jgi:hypothetical protein
LSWSAGRIFVTNCSGYRLSATERTGDIVPIPENGLPRTPSRSGPTGVTAQVDDRENYLEVDGMAEEWRSTISRRAPFLT